MGTASQALFREHLVSEMISIFEEMKLMIDEGSTVDVVYMEFGKAFNKVPPGRLIQKVKMYGIHSDFKVCILSLLNTEERIAVEGCFSVRRSVTSGVLQ